MSEYGTQPNGFARKPLQVILQEIEADAIRIFGEGLIQTSESPQGQQNGLYAYSVNELWEIAEDVYQSFDPDQAEDRRLESIAKLRLLRRNGMSNIDLRKQINNEGVTKFNLKDVEQSLLPIEGITYLKTFINDDGQLTPFGPKPGELVVAVIGGDDSAIADRLFLVLPIGGLTYGNTEVSTTTASTASQSFNILRVSEAQIRVDLQIRLNDDSFDRFQPDISRIISGFVEEWDASNVNGKDVNSFNLRNVIECKFPGIQLMSFTAGVVNGSTRALNETLGIGFSAIPRIKIENVTANFV